MPEPAACAHLTGAPGTTVARLLRVVIAGYQRYISPVIGQHCRFYPTCSRYAAVAISRHGVMRGGVMAAKRILRCHPFHPGGVDLVPERDARAADCS